MSADIVPRIYPLPDDRADVDTGYVDESKMDREVSSPEREAQAILEAVAKQLVEYSLEIKEGDNLLIELSPSGWQLCSMIRTIALGLRANVVIIYADSKNVVRPVREVLVPISGVESPDGKKPKKPDSEKPEGPDMKDSVGAFRLPLKEEDQETDLYAELDLAQRTRRFIEDGVRADEQRAVRWAHKVLVIRDNTTDDLALARSIQKVYKSAQSEVTDERLAKQWCLIYVPNEEEAKAAGMSLIDYQRVYFEACDRPWQKVEVAQTHLVEQLQSFQEARIECAAPPGWNSERWATNVTMSIEGMVAANSLAKRNMPGSEVFLAPVRNTISGQYTIPYPVRFEDRNLPNLGIRFEKGQVVDFWIDNPNPGDMEYVGGLLDTPNSGLREVGELGIGTNPLIQQAFMNTLLVEKAGGSVHLALGKAYSEKDYFGQQVNVDNGVRGDYHIDMTRMLTPEYGGGRIVLIKSH